jgi:NADH:ubiquinone oxidoreductase subunit 2 (subunit N)
VLSSNVSYNESLFATLAINIFVYIFTLFLLFLLFNIVPSIRLKYSNLFSTLAVLPSLKFFFIIGFLSLCGIPPLAGFFAKLYILVNLFNGSSYFLIFLIFFFNLFAMFFYLQNTRFLINDSKLKVFKLANFNYTLALSVRSAFIWFALFIVSAYIYMDTAYIFFIAIII